MLSSYVNRSMARRQFSDLAVTAVEAPSCAEWQPWIISAYYQKAHGQNVSIYRTTESQSIC